MSGTVASKIFEVLASAQSKGTNLAKLRPGGHIWPVELLNPARGAFTIIPPKAK